MEEGTLPVKRLERLSSPKESRVEGARKGSRKLLEKASLKGGSALNGKV